MPEQMNQTLRDGEPAEPHAAAAAAVSPRVMQTSPFQPARGWLPQNIPVFRQDPGFPRAAGRYYLDVFADLHARLDIDWYLEIGTETGKGLVDVRANVISVDPTYQLRYDAIGTKREVHFFQKTSDDFFGSGYLDRMGIRLDMAFLDGMHLFEYLLRDFINTERHMKPDGCVMMHDCIPFNHDMATRERERTDVPWTGDVWKILPILAAHRPDLKVRALDASPTGVLLIENLDPMNAALRDNYDSIVADYLDLTLRDFGLDRFTGAFPLVDCESLLERGAA